MPQAAWVSRVSHIVITVLTALAGLGTLAGCAARPAWPLAPGQHEQQFARPVRVEANGRLLLFLPAHFERHPHTRYPLLIFLHGSGESGQDLEKVKAHGPPQLLADRPDFPFIVASPQAPGAEEGFDIVALNAMLDELLERLPIDPNRVYLTGLSMGGYATYAWAIHDPERFAAIAPVCGMWRPGAACRLKHIPVWAFHGAKDDVVPLAEDQAMVDAIRACGGGVTFTVYPDVGHDAWTPAYQDPRLYQWLLQQRREPHAH